MSMRATVTQGKQAEKREVEGCQNPSIFFLAYWPYSKPATHELDHKRRVTMWTAVILSKLYQTEFNRKGILCIRLLQ